jgi:RNA polymerase sigma-70 factor (ECF subfamily)
MTKNDPGMDELIVRAREGDRDALGKLLERQRVPLRAIAQRKIGGALAARIDASDVVQQTCLSVYGNLEKFQGKTEGEFVAWLERIHEQNLQNVIRDHTRAQKRAVDRELPLDAGGGGGQLPSANAATPSQRAMRDEEAVNLLRVLDKLPDDQQLVVRLRHLEGWSLAQISAHLNRSEAAVVGLLKRGMQNLRRDMRADEKC